MIEQPNRQMSIGDSILPTTKLHKLHVELIWLACQSLQVVAAECIFVGDSPGHMQGATTAGCYKVGAGWSPRSAGEPAQAGAGLVIYRLAALLALNDLLEDLLQDREPLQSRPVPQAAAEKRCVK